MSGFKLPATYYDPPEFKCKNESCDGETCQECCQHDELDHGICMDCELDMSDDIAARAYDRAKDLRKYGE